MESLLLGYEDIFDTAISTEDSAICEIKKIISGGFENHKIPEDSMPSIQIIHNSTQLSERGTRCDIYEHSMEVRLVYNVKHFIGNIDSIGRIERINATHKVRAMVEGDGCKYDPTTVIGAINTNLSVMYEDRQVGYDARVTSIDYGIFTRGSGNGLFPTGEAVVGFSVFSSLSR